VNEPTNELGAVADPHDRMWEPLPRPGSGQTAARFRALWKLASRSPSLGRLAEAHHDAVAILAEAGRDDPPTGLLAVWAAGGPHPLRLIRQGSHWWLRGDKHWCSGAGLAASALVTAELDDGSGALVHIDMQNPGATLGSPEWTSPAMPAVDTRTVHFDAAITDDDVVGRGDWYVRRTGFWHGAIGVAACWAGCVDGVVRRLWPAWPADPHATAHLGAIDAQLWNLAVALDAAADAVDDDPTSTERGEQRALRVRHVVDVGVADITTRIMRAVGPGPLAHGDDVHRHLAETDLYRRQCHAERDLEALGRLVRGQPDPCERQ